MTTSLAFCADTGAPLIEVHRIAPADDPKASRPQLSGSSAPKPGSRFWLNRAQTLEFLPLTDVKASQDLLGDAVIEEGVTDVHYSHQPNRSLAQQIRR